MTPSAVWSFAQMMTSGSGSPAASRRWITLAPPDAEVVPLPIGAAGQRRLGTRDTAAAIT